MPKGHYAVQAESDTSFRSCVCFLGIFLLICILIIVISFASIKKSDGTNTGPSDSISDSGLHGTKPSVASTTTTTRTTTTTPTTASTSTTTRKSIKRPPPPPVKPDDEYDDYGGDAHDKIIENISTTTSSPPTVKEDKTSIKKAKVPRNESTEEVTSSTPSVPTTMRTVKTSPPLDESSVKYLGSVTKEIKSIVIPPVTTDDSSTVPTSGDWSSPEPAVTEMWERTASSDLPASDDLPETETPIADTVSGGNISATEPDLVTEATPHPTTLLEVPSVYVSKITEPESEEEVHTFPPTSTTPAASTMSVADLLSKLSSGLGPVATPKRSEEENICESLQCSRLSARSLSLMSLDQDVDACKDFYEFACGGLRQDPYLLPHNYWDEVWKRIEGEVKNVSAEDPIAYKKFQKYLKSCEQDTANETVWTELIKQELEHIGFSTKPTNFTHIFTQLILNDSPLFFDVQLDIKTTGITENRTQSRFTLKIVPSDVSENSFDFPKTEVRTCERRAATEEINLTNTYRQIIDCLKNEGMDTVLTDAEKALKNLYNDTEKISNFKLSIETIVGRVNNETLGKSTAYHRRILQNREFDKITAAELNEIFPLVNWTQLLEGLTNGKIEEPVHVYDKNYLKKVFSEIKDHSDDSIAEALQAWFVTARRRQLLQPSPDARDPFFCSRRASSLLRGVASALYLRSFDPAYVQKLHDNVFTIFRDVKDQLFKELRNVSLMTEEIREKVDSINPSIFSNETIPKDELLDKELEEYDVSEDNFLNNTIRLMSFHRRRTYGLVGEDPTDYIWTYFLPVFDVRGKSIYELNTIAIPLGMAAPPFFDPEYPRYIQYAGLGFAIAHELAHHCDWTGIQFLKGEKKGDVVYDKYISKLPSAFSDRVSGKYFSYQLSEDHAKDNEYFADLSGMTLAFRTYQFVRRTQVIASLPYLNLSTSQAFFVHAAQRFCTRVPVNEMVLDLFEDVHFPPPFRVSRMSAIDIFHTSFGCPGEGTPAFPYVLHDEDV